MTTFTLHLQSSTRDEEITNVSHFVGEDKTGQFGILAHHARMMTCLCFGLCHFQTNGKEIEYLALPGGVLYFINNHLYICTRQYLRDKNYQILEKALDEEFSQEETNLVATKKSLHKLNESLMKHLWELEKRFQHES